MENPKLDFILYNTKNNSTLHLTGQLNLTRSGVMSSDTGNATEAAKNQNGGLLDDGTGALLFVVAVIVVYGMSVCLLVVTLTRRKSVRKSIDKEVSLYIKGLEGARQEAKRETVLRSRLKWPGNWIGLRFSSRNPIQQATVSGAPENGNDSDTSSYTEYPATTILVNSEDHNSGEEQLKVPEEIMRSTNGYPQHFSRRRASYQHYTQMVKLENNMNETPFSGLHQGEDLTDLELSDISIESSDSSYIPQPSTEPRAEGFQEDKLIPKIIIEDGEI